MTHSQTIAQASCQTHRQSLLHHLALSDSNIIRNTVESSHLSLTIIDSITGSGVAIPRLPYAAGIDNQSAFAQHQSNIRQERVRDTITGITIPEHQRYVRMPHQAELRLEEGKIYSGITD